MKNAVFWDIMKTVLVRTDVSEERNAFIIKKAVVGEYLFVACICC
jgi:hypothetical protein